jgi:hypothetical protein
MAIFVSLSFKSFLQVAKKLKITIATSLAHDPLDLSYEIGMKNRWYTIGRWGGENATINQFKDSFVRSVITQLTPLLIPIRGYQIHTIPKKRKVHPNSFILSLLIFFCLYRHLE